MNLNGIFYAVTVKIGSFPSVENLYVFGNQGNEMSIQIFYCNSVTRSLWLVVTIINLQFRYKKEY